MKNLNQNDDYNKYYPLVCLLTSAFVSPSTTIISTTTLSISLESLPSAFFLGAFLYLMMICSSLGIPLGKKSSTLLNPKTFFRIPKCLKLYFSG